MSIAIVGGGITGLTTALALDKLGINYHVFEKAAELNEVGAGILLQPNAMKVLDWLGLCEKISAHGVSLSKVEITDNNLVPIRKSSVGLVETNSGNEIISIHRAKLQKILFDAIDRKKVSLGTTLKSFSEGANGLKLAFDNSSFEAKLLLAADGINSVTRKLMIPNTRRRFSGQTCWRGTCKMKLPEKFKSTGNEAWGNQVRFGIVSISKDEIYWFAVSNAPENEKDNPDAIKQTLKPVFKKFNPLINEIITNTPKEGIIRNDLYDLKRLTTWHQGRTCLIGDAAHATTPNMGQGAGQGIEDAYYLSNFLTQSSDHKNVFSEFERYRRAKVDEVVNTSWTIGRMAHSRFGQPLMKLAIKLTPEVILKKKLDALYSIDEDVKLKL